MRRERRIFWRGELENRGRRLRRGKRKKESSGRIWRDFLFFNEIQKKIVDMEITFPGGTSKGRIG